MSLGDYIREFTLYSRKVAQVIDQIGVTNAGTSTGSADAYVFDLESITGVRPPVRLVDSERFRFIPNFTNAAANPTVTVSTTIGSKIVKGANGTSALGASAITSGYPTEIQYDLANDVYRLIFSSLPSSGGVSDGDKGDITVSGGGSIWSIDNATITKAKIASDLDAYIIAMAVAL